MMDLGKHNGYTFKVSNEFKGEYLDKGISP